jgi:replicative DNA helicase
MSEQTENTFTAYLGPEFQQKLMWQLLVEPEYAEKTLPILAVEYFDDPNFKRLFLIILEYYKAYLKVPNLQNQSINQAINEFKTPNNVIEEESLFAVIDKIKLWNERILNKTLMHDGEAVQSSTDFFIKQQEYRKFAESVLVKVKNGEIKNKHSIAEIEEKLHKISLIGNKEDDGIDVTEGLEKALRKEFRKTVPTGVKAIDALTGGGLGKGEIGLILTPSGVGKTTLLTVIANTAREQNLNVLQIVFEDTIQQIQRKHVAIWTGIPLSQLDDKNDEALLKSNEHIEKLGAGKLTIKKFSQEDTTMRDIKDFIVREQKKWGFKYDIVILDYLDCLESHKRTADRNEAELVIVKSFEAMASDLDIPCWSAIQSNRSGFDAELVEAHQTGGSIKRLQKAHFFMSVAKTPDQKEASLASIRIIKARFAQDGQTFKDCIFNNDSMQIVIKDDKYVGDGYVHKKRVTDEVIEENAKKIEEHAKGNAGLLHPIISSAMPDTPEDPLLGDMREKFMEQKKIETDIVNIHIETTRTDLSQDEINQITEITKYVTKEDILELEDKPIEIFDGVNEGVSDAINDDVKEPILDWSGETFTTAMNEIEVKHEDIKAGDVIKPSETGPTYLPAGVFTRDESNNIVVLGVATESKITPVAKKIVSAKEKIDISEVEKKLNFDPEEATPAKKHVFEMLCNKSKTQGVIKKE